MPKISYEPCKFRQDSLRMIEHANRIIKEYAQQGYDLTLRQLFYQFVSRGLIPNRTEEYKKLGTLVSKGRRAGLIDWDSIVDRTRNLHTVGSWDSPGDIIETCAKAFKLDLWQNQPNYVECFFEKDALMGVFERATAQYRLPFFSCRGYSSDSEMWSAAQRFKRESNKHTKCYVLHFGDHDPSGIDMSRDIEDRLFLFRANVVLKRVALNMDQIQQYNPPPNPAKDTDTRFSSYQQMFGDESWELDALEPTVISDLIVAEMEELIDWPQWDEDKSREDNAKEQLKYVSENFEDLLAGRNGEDDD